MDGASINAASFDYVFEVSSDGKTLSMAPSIARFDMDDGGSASLNQTGFASLNADLAVASGEQNGVTLTVTGNAAGNGRDRGTGGNVASSPVPDVTRDFVFDDDGRGFPTPYFTVELDGLLPNTLYAMRWHHYENGGSGVENRLALYEDSAVPANLLFESLPYGSNTTNYFTDFLAATDGFGQMTLVTGPHSGGRSIQMFNGLEVRSVEGEVPEPLTMALLSLAACGLGGYVRRRTA